MTGIVRDNLAIIVVALVGTCVLVICVLFAHERSNQSNSNEDIAAVDASLQGYPPEALRDSTSITPIAFDIVESRSAKDELNTSWSTPQAELLGIVGSILPTSAGLDIAPPANNAAEPTRDFSVLRRLPPIEDAAPIADSPRLEIQHDSEVSDHSAFRESNSANDLPDPSPLDFSDFETGNDSTSTDSEPTPSFNILDEPVPTDEGSKALEIQPRFDSPNDFIPENEPTLNAGAPERPSGHDELLPTEPTINSAMLDQPELPRVRNGLAMSVVTQRADEIVEHGFSLASRNATFSARAEFLAALRSVAEALDAYDGGTFHTASLDAGLTALREVEDFIPKNAESSIDVRQTIRGHETPVLKHSRDGEVSPIVARQRYYTYAQTKLSEACEGNPAASRALYSLGKLYSAQALSSTDAQMTNAPNAMVFHRAAMMVNPGNHLAANELGVMLARYGELEYAKQVLLSSLSVNRLPEAWHNLSVVHERLGEHDLARRAKYEWQLSQNQTRKYRGSGASPAKDLIRWVDAAEFAGSLPASNALGQPTGMAGQVQSLPSRAGNQMGGRVNR